ncbi:MAG: DNA-protecting protein DprA [Leptospiraceae bacterium]|nr:DNA-protecting protein DprA [Leptospiraceae bacterium]MCP5497434.1 DNA-protecting protein DprA [Leptospiraceae bacterium]
MEDEIIPYLFSFSKLSSVVKKLGCLNQFDSIKGLYDFIKQSYNKPELEKIIQAAKLVKSSSEKNSIQVLDYYDPDYPAYLKEIYDPPITLFVKGDKQLLNNTFVSVVGTRKASKLSLDACSSLPDFVKKNLYDGIVSGLASGIDRAAMLACIEQGIPTVGVLGTGLDSEYPHANKDLYKKMNEFPKGVIISEMKYGDPPNRWSFPRRNRIITGMSALLLIMESPLKSGAMSSANHAISQNRDIAVFLHEGQHSNEGGKKLVEDGAICLSYEELTGKNTVFHISQVLEGGMDTLPHLISQTNYLELTGKIKYIGDGYYKEF